MVQPAEMPVIDTGTREYRDPLGRARPFTYLFSALAIAVMAVVWDLPTLWPVAGGVALLTPFAFFLRKSRRLHHGLVIDCFISVGAMLVAGVPITSVSFILAANVAAAYLIYRPTEARWVIGAVIAALGLGFVFEDHVAIVQLTHSQLLVARTLASVVGLVLLMSLVPELGRIINERREFQDRLLATQRQFTSMVSHELRSPLTSIKGFTMLLSEATDFTDEERHEIYQLIEREADSLGMLVDDILVIMRFESGNLKVAVEQVGVREAADEIMVALGHMAAGRTVTVEIDPDHRAIGDAARIRQVIRNLVTNAIKYGGTTIKISSEMVGTELRLSISDDGDGIPDTLRSELFGDFSQGTNAAQSTGFGLGLGISRRLARLMNGDLDYEDVDPTGARFTLALPAG